MGTLSTEPSPTTPESIAYPPPAHGPGHAHEIERQIDTEHDSLDERVNELVVETGSGFELFCGAIAILLGVLGLAGYYEIYLAAGATVAVGFAMLAQGSTIATRWRRAVHLADTERTERLGMTTEMFGGLVLIVLGVLAVLGVEPVTLLAAASLVIGVALLLGGPTQPSFVPVPSGVSPVHWEVQRGPGRTSAGVMVMAGLAAVVLGLSALLEWGPAIPLVLVAMACTGAALVLTGGTLATRIAHRFA